MYINIVDNKPIPEGIDIGRGRVILQQWHPFLMPLSIGHASTQYWV